MKRNFTFLYSCSLPRPIGAQAFLLTEVLHKSKVIGQAMKLLRKKYYVISDKKATKKMEGR